MEEDQNLRSCSDGGEELVNELLDNESPFMVVEKDHRVINHGESKSKSNSHLISSTLYNYSGPTIQHVQDALLLTASRRFPAMGRGFRQSESKYTLKIKSCGNGMADDGYKWRKYGQKSIKNSPNPRSYYKCTNPRCSAKKQVEKSNEEPDTLIVTYEGLHLHFVYPFSLVPDKTVPTKKFKKIHLNSQIEAYKDESQKNLGLLEDMVPLIVRHPSNTTSSSYSSSSSSSSSSSISPSSLTCSFNSAPSHFYLCINTTIS
ncbi:probable WRKY transcription factor 49 isoform X2 [Carica papaya]|uniref:probable WRKY transcription factor 49 isoform X2 n=1 Tax=Carica papaya TaxID=3649 RepID=UPI000B8C87B8|nr:probable WRKY transcription factor 49 isoform X2 [Carica papaya]